MGIRSSATLLAAVTAAFVIAPGLSALAQFSPPGFGGTGQTTGQGKSDTSNRMGGGGGAKAGGAATNRMGGGGGKGAGGASRMGGGGGKGAGGASRMGGGGGKGAVQLNPQPEPPGRAKIK